MSEPSVVLLTLLAVIAIVVLLLSVDDWSNDTLFALMVILGLGFVACSLVVVFRHETEPPPGLSGGDAAIRRDLALEMVDRAEHLPRAEAPRFGAGPWRTR